MSQQEKYEETPYHQLPDGSIDYKHYDGLARRLRGRSWHQSFQAISERIRSMFRPKRRVRLKDPLDIKTRIVIQTERRKKPSRNAPRKLDTEPLVKDRIKSQRCA